MNKNIEVINNNLWAVNYHHLEYIKEITYSDTSPDAMDKPAFITHDGVIVLNKSHELYITFMKVISTRIMSRTDEELHLQINYMKDKNRDGYDRVLKFCLDAETKRRMVEKKFKEQAKDEPVIKKVLKFIGFNQ